MRFFRATLIAHDHDAQTRRAISRYGHIKRAIVCASVKGKLRVASHMATVRRAAMTQIRSEDEWKALFLRQGEVLEKHAAELAKLRAERDAAVSNLHQYEAICHCGTPLRFHKADDHAPTEMRVPCIYAAEHAAFKAALVSDEAVDAAAREFVSQAHDESNGWNTLSDSEKRGMKLICRDQIKAAIAAAEKAVDK